jgi:hypothetical protein
MQMYSEREADNQSKTIMFFTFVGFLIGHFIPTLQLAKVIVLPVTSILDMIFR